MRAVESSVKLLIWTFRLSPGAISVSDPASVVGVGKILGLQCEREKRGQKRTRVRSFLVHVFGCVFLRLTLSV